MAAVAALMQEAENRVKAAVGQETEDGDPELAAAHYARAGELILVILKDYDFSSPDAAAWVAGTLTPKLLEYTERAQLMLSVAEEATAEKEAAADTEVVAGGNAPVAAMEAPKQVDTEDDDDDDDAGATAGTATAATGETNAAAPTGFHVDPAAAPADGEEDRPLGGAPSIGTLLNKFKDDE